MSALILSASTLFNSISSIFSGIYKSSNQDYVAIKEEILDLTIPSIENDRKNSTTDLKNIGADLKKSVKEYGQKS
jgi:hypothetical protein